MKTLITKLNTNLLLIDQQSIFECLKRTPQGGPCVFWFVQVTSNFWKCLQRADIAKTKLHFPDVLTDVVCIIPMRCIGPCHRCGAELPGESRVWYALC